VKIVKSPFSANHQITILSQSPNHHSQPITKSQFSEFVFDLFELTG